MKNVKDLTTQEIQGRFGHDKIDSLTSPGLYKVKIRNYKVGPGMNGKSSDSIDLIVNVVSVFEDQGTQMIVVADTNHDYYYIFYYNGAEQVFKPNFDADNDYHEILNWINYEED